MRRTPLARVSAKRKAQAADYDRARTSAFLRDRGQCQAQNLWPEIECAGRIDPHHIRPQSQYPELRCDVNNLVCLCRAHHDAAHHVNPLKARALGLVK